MSVRQTQDHRPFILGDRALRGAEAGCILDRDKMTVFHTKQPCQSVLGLHHRLSLILGISDNKEERLRRAKDEMKRGLQVWWN